MKNKSIKTVITFLIIIFFSYSLYSISTPAKGDSAVLCVSFGTTHLDTLDKTIGNIEKNIKKEFKNLPVYRAFTSEIVRKRLLEKKIEVDSPSQALLKLKKLGFKNIYIQPLHIIKGFEFNEIKKTAQKDEFKMLNIKISSPLLSTAKDYSRVKDIISNYIKKGVYKKPLILMGHGTHHKADASYAKLQKTFTPESKVFISTVEGKLNIDTLIKKLKAENIKEVTLAPFMIVAGDHAKNDMAGKEEDSWMSVLKKNNIKASSVLKGLGEIREISEIFADHLRETMK